MAAFVIFTPMTILTYIAVSWFLVNFEPLQLLIDSIYSKFKPSYPSNVSTFICYLYEMRIFLANINLHLVIH
jgi:hypothetical protein